MKAIKIYNINWNLSSVSKEVREDLLKGLPTVKGFFAPDNFNVIEQANAFLKKRYGFESNSFSFNEYRVATTLEELLMLCAPKGEKPKSLYTPTAHLSSYGTHCYEILKFNLMHLKEMNSNNVPEEKIPVICDECMIGVEKVLGLKWDETTLEEIESVIDLQIETYHQMHAPIKKAKPVVYNTADIEAPVKPAAAKEANGEE